MLCLYRENKAGCIHYYSFFAQYVTCIISTRSRCLKALGIVSFCLGVAPPALVTDRPHVGGVGGTNRCLLLTLNEKVCFDWCDVVPLVPVKRVEGGRWFINPSFAIAFVREEAQTAQNVPSLKRRWRGNNCSLSSLGILYLSAVKLIPFWIFANFTYRTFTATTLKLYVLYQPY